MKNLANRNLVVCDLDGSLLRSDETISDFSVSTIKKFIKKGNIFCIATGRPIRAAIDYYNQLGLNTIMANLNGGILINPSKPDFSLLNLGFSSDTVKFLFSNKKLLSHITCVFVESIDATYLFTDKKNEYLKWEFLSKFHVASNSKKGNFKILKLNEFESLNNEINSILIYIENKERLDYVTFKIKEFTSTLVVRNWSLPSDFAGTVIEVNSIFSNKGTAIKFLSSYYMIPLSQTYSFGDGENDLDMLSKSNGYAMKNSSYTVKLLTNKITTHTNDEDGIAIQMKKLFNL
ncbi:MAG: HAD family hydrolase [Malacoplasma sp.]|nr:HAD family hydrolase [Malacoplasma sp.]